MSKKDKESKDKETLVDENLGERLKIFLKSKENNSQKNNENEESEEVNLEKVLETNFDFNQISWPNIDAKAPVLEKIASEQSGPVFVGQMSRRPQTTPGEESGNDEFQYVQGQENNDETKYMNNSTRIDVNPERVDISRVGRDTGRLNLRDASSPQSYQPNVESPVREKAWRAERIDTENVGREKDSQLREIKYEKYDSKN